MRKYALIIGFLLPFLSCEAIIDDAINCGPKDAVLEKKQLRVGKVNVNYVDSIKASVKNEPGDDDYPYNFFIEGNLPKGLYGEVYRNKLDILGIPTEAGSFRINITVSVTFGEDPTCSKSTTESYIISITE
ncbi:hypothetical protein [Namhaeicola litoreus]|uniref:Uncharacterized protein n=1 Tax=Namhaeicola litoreus TaxID=1052145 RepID=A0ABW3Y3J8_9FLAO